MKITAIKTHKITNKDADLFLILDRYVRRLSEKSVVAVSSKIVSITEGRIVPIRKVAKVGKVSNGDRKKDQKDQLIEQEAEYFLPRSSSKYNVRFTITNNILAAGAGIDESNGAGFYILWPKDPQKNANMLRSHLMSRSHLSNIGVIITDSKATPLRWGVTGLAIAHSGFRALNSYIGKRDLFGRKFEFEKLNVMDSLASAAVLAMGEGSEQTPLAIIEDLPFVQFQKRNPTAPELRSLKIPLEDDLYAPLLESVRWIKSKRKSRPK